MKSNKLFLFSLALGLFSMTSCGGSGDSGNGMLIEGTLTEAREAGHAALRHGAGDRIEDVTVCALGECSITDAEGRWGVIAPETFSGGQVLFSVNGHFIESSLTVDVPSAEHVFIDLRRVESGVEAHQVSIGGGAGEH
jgi:hypothetical protein